MSKELSWTERVKKFNDGVKEVGERCRTGMGKIQKATTIMCIDQIVASEVSRLELIVRHPDIDVQAVYELLQGDEYEDLKTKENSKYPNNEHIHGFEDYIAELKSKHPNLDWEALEEKIIKVVRF